MVASPLDPFHASSRDRGVPPTILVVEDEVLRRLGITEELRDHKFTVLEAASTEEAMKVLNSAVTIDLVFTVTGMPGEIDGAALAQWLRRERPNVKVCIASAELAPSDADAVVAKPYVRHDVLQTIRELLGVPEPQGPDRLRERRIAAECLALSQQTSDFNLRVSLLSIAQKWLDLADLGPRHYDATDFGAMRTQIGRELRALYGLPHMLPHRLFTLLAQLNGPPGPTPAATAGDKGEGEA
jgi:CheY-like chemotaxis protein